MKLVHAIGQYLIRKMNQRSRLFRWSRTYDTLSDPKALRAMRLPADAYEADWPPRPGRRAQQQPR